MAAVVGFFVGERVFFFCKCRFSLWFCSERFASRWCHRVWIWRMVLFLVFFVKSPVKHLIPVRLRVAGFLYISVWFAVILFFQKNKKKQKKHGCFESQIHPHLFMWGQFKAVKWAKSRFHDRSQVFLGFPLSLITLDGATLSTSFSAEQSLLSAFMWSDYIKEIVQIFWSGRFVNSFILDSSLNAVVWLNRQTKV